MDQTEAKWKAKTAVELQRAERLRLQREKLIAENIRKSEIESERDRRVTGMREELAKLTPRIVGAISPLRQDLPQEQTTDAAAAVSRVADAIARVVEHECRAWCNEQAGQS